MIYYIYLISCAESLHLDVTINESLTCTYLNGHLVSFLSGYFTLSNENLSSVLIFSTAINILTVMEIFGPFVITLFIIIVIGKNAPFFGCSFCFCFFFLARWLWQLLWTLWFVFLFFYLTSFKILNSSLNGSFRFPIIVAIWLLL